MNSGHLLQLCQILWLVQIIMCLLYLVIPNIFKLNILKTLVIFLGLNVVLGFLIFFTGLYALTPGGTCGTERFNPITMLSFYGNFVSLLIYIIFSIILKLSVFIKGLF